MTEFDGKDYCRRFNAAVAALGEFHASKQTARKRAWQRRVNRQLEWASRQIENALQAPGPRTGMRHRQYAMQHMVKAEELLGKGQAEAGS